MFTIRRRIIELVATAVGAAALAGAGLSGLGVATANALPPDPCMVDSCPAVVNPTAGSNPIKLNPQPLPPGFRMLIAIGQLPHK